MVVTAATRASIFGQPGRVDRVQVVTPWGLAVQCHKLLAPRFVAACQEAHAQPWKPQRIDSYNPRPIRGTDGDTLAEWSLHSWALAFDFFATPPNVPPPGGVWTPDNGVPPEFAAVFERYGFRWGGRWTSRRDVPHIEWADGLPPAQPPQEDDMPTADEVAAAVIAKLDEGIPQGGQPFRPSVYTIAATVAQLQLDVKALRGEVAKITASPTSGTVSVTGTLELG